MSSDEVPDDPAHQLIAGRVQVAVPQRRGREAAHDHATPAQRQHAVARRSAGNLVARASLEESGFEHARGVAAVEADVGDVGDGEAGAVHLLELADDVDRWVRIRRYACDANGSARDDTT